MEPKITYLKRKIIFQTSIIMFHVNLRGCNNPVASKLPILRTPTPVLYRFKPLHWRVQWFLGKLHFSSLQVSLHWGCGARVFRFLSWSPASIASGAWHNLGLEMYSKVFGLVVQPILRFLHLEMSSSLGKYYTSFVANHFKIL